MSDIDDAILARMARFSPPAEAPEMAADATYAARDRALANAFGMDAPEHGNPDMSEAVAALGVRIDNLDPAAPTLYDPRSETGYWVGVYQDPATPNTAVTSVLSVGPDADGRPEAHLAPVTVGDPAHAERAAAYLMKMADKTRDVDQVLDAAEGMAVATQNRELWDTPRGIPVAEDIRFTTPEIE